MYLCVFAYDCPSNAAVPEGFAYISWTNRNKPKVWPILLAPKWTDPKGILGNRLIWTGVDLDLLWFGAFFLWFWPRCSALTRPKSKTKASRARRSLRSLRSLRSQYRWLTFLLLFLVFYYYFFIFFFYAYGPLGPSAEEDKKFMCTGLMRSRKHACFPRAFSRTWGAVQKPPRTKNHLFRSEMTPNPSNPWKLVKTCKSAMLPVNYDSSFPV